MKPKALKPGDTLALVANSTPANHLSADAFARGCRALEALGFRIQEAPNLRTLSGHTAGTIQDRVDALHWAFSDPAINGILNFWGGYQSHQLLEYLNFDLIRQNPKVFVGYSDTTSLHVGIHKATGLVTFNGPAFITFAKPTVPDFTRTHFQNTLMRVSPELSLFPSAEHSENPWYQAKPEAMIFEKNPGWKVYRHGTAKGATIGGNAGTMLLLAGTPYWPDFRGKILILEEDESETTNTIDRMFTQFRQMGVFKEISGLVIGRFHSDVGLKPGDSLEMILDDALRGTEFPVIMEVDFGHTDPLMTVPMGIQFQIKTEGLELKFLESAVT